MTSSISWTLTASTPFSDTKTETASSGTATMGPGLAPPSQTLDDGSFEPSDGPDVFNVAVAFGAGAFDGGAFDAGLDSDTLDFSGFGSVEIFLSEQPANFNIANESASIIGFENVVGAIGADFIQGDDGVNRLEGGDGDDQLRGLGGDDALFGGAGSDTAIFAGLRDAYVVSREGDEVVVAGPDGVDRLVDIELLAFSDAVEPTAFALPSDAMVDIVNGGVSSDRLDGGDARERIEGFGGADRISGGGGDDLLNGGNGADRIFGDDGDDLILGGDDADITSPGEGRDFVDGGPGVDALFYDFTDAAAGVTLVAPEFGPARTADVDVPGQGLDEVINVEVLVVTGSAFADSISGDRANLYYLEGGGGDDVLIGGAGHDTLIGGAGDDSLSGSSIDELFDGDDVLDGGEGDDVLFGGTGDDLLKGGAGADTARFSGFSVQYSVAGDVAAAVVTGPDGADFLFGVETLQFDDVTMDLPETAEAGVAAFGDADLGTAFRGQRAVFQPESFGLATLTGIAEFGGESNIDLRDSNVIPNAPQVDAGGVIILETVDSLTPTLVVESAPFATKGGYPFGEVKVSDDGLSIDTSTGWANPNADGAFTFFVAGTDATGQAMVVRAAFGLTAVDDAVVPSETDVAVFDSSYYLGVGPNADLLSIGVDTPDEAFEHWFLVGFAEGRAFSPLRDSPGLIFDAEFYVSQDASIQADLDAGVAADALEHYIAIGSALDTPDGSGGPQYNPNQFFDPATYRDANPDISAGRDFFGNEVDPFVHYLQFGEAEAISGALGRRAGFNGFDPNFYSEENDDVATFINAGPGENLGLVTYFQHFVEAGVSEGRPGAPPEGGRIAEEPVAAGMSWIAADPDALI